jgi:hypothetical protein
LFSNEELVACLSIRKKSKDNSIEIARFVTKNFYSVRGGFSKLLKYIERIHNPKCIVSFCDLRYSTCSSYEKLGFKLNSSSLGWRWTDFKNTHNRLACKANMDDRKLTQAQYAEELGWVKIYDAGQAKYTKEL